MKKGIKIKETGVSGGLDGPLCLQSPHDEMVVALCAQLRTVQAAALIMNKRKKKEGIW